MGRNDQEADRETWKRGMEGALLVEVRGISMVLFYFQTIRSQESCVEIVEDGGR